MKVLMKSKWRVNTVSDHVYHTKEDCQYIDKAKAGVFREVELEEVPDDARECKACSGTADNERPERDSLAESIENNDIDPEDIGLSPMGER
jgi:hypothetical protein